MRKIVETVKEYDKDGNLTRESVTETTEEGPAEKLYEPYPIYPYFPPFDPFHPTVTYDTGTAPLKRAEVQSGI